MEISRKEHILTPSVPHLEGSGSDVGQKSQKENGATLKSGDKQTAVPSAGSE